ncbi:mCG4983, partial [Mus musculus]
VHYLHSGVSKPGRLFPQAFDAWSVSGDRILMTRIFSLGNSKLLRCSLREESWSSIHSQPITIAHQELIYMTEATALCLWDGASPGAILKGLVLHFLQEGSGPLRLS